MNGIPQMELKSEEPAYRQVEQVLRASIMNGELPCGLRLPTVQELAVRYSTSVFTIQTALDALAKDGLIERARRRGTFVTSRSTKLRQVGVYFGRNFVRGHAMGFYQELHQQLSQELGARDVLHRLWIDGRSKNKRNEPLRDLAEAVAKNEIQALIICVTSMAELTWLQQLELPLALLGTRPVSYRVGLNDDKGMQLAMQEFKRQGCRTVGAVLPISPTVYDPREKDAPPTTQDLFLSFYSRMAECGLTTRDSWMRIPDKMMGSTLEYERYGYRQFKDLWSQPERPDGLLIWPDSVAHGCITAILENGIPVPDDLKLVIHRNTGVPILCPLAAAWIEFDVSLIAKALITQAERQIAGMPVMPILIPPALHARGLNKSSIEPS